VIRNPFLGPDADRTASTGADNRYYSVEVDAGTKV